MSKKQITRIRKFLRSDATPLSTEAIEEIRNAQKNIPNAERIMCKRHRIGASRYKNIINNQIPLEPTDEWCKIINSVCIEPSSHPVAPLPFLEVKQVSEVEQVISEWQASGEQEEKNISARSEGASAPALLKRPERTEEPAETASEMSTTFSDTSSVSSDKIIPSKSCFT